MAEEYTIEIDDEGAGISGADPSKVDEEKSKQDVGSENISGGQGTDNKPSDGDQGVDEKASDENDAQELLKRKFDALQGQLAQMQQSQRMANEQMQQQRRAENERRSQIAVLETGIENENARSRRAEHEYARALEANDHVSAAAAQRVMAEVSANLTQMRAGLETIRDDSFERPEVVRQPQQQTGDQVEAAISTFTPASQKWLRAHKDDIFGNSQRAQLAQAAHITAINSGIAIDTDAYFAHLDKTMGYSQKNVPNRGTAAPVTRQNNGGPAGKRSVTLSHAEMEHCKATGTSPVEYAKAKYRIQSGNSTLRYRGNSHG